MSTQDMQFVDYDYWHYLKNLLVLRESENPIPESEQALLRGIITLDECFMLQVLCNAQLCTYNDLLIIVSVYFIVKILVERFIK